MGRREKKGFMAGWAPWQIAPWSQWEKLAGCIFLQISVVTEPKLRASANDRVR